MSSLLTQLADSARRSRDAQGAILTTEFLGTCRELLPIIDKFGSGFSLVRSDIGGNIDRLAAAQAKDPSRYTTLFTIVTDEVQRGEQEGKQSDTNGLLWLKRATEFILLLLKRLHDDTDVALSTAASEVYYQTLNKYHTWYTAAAFTVVLKFVPSREAFFAALGSPGEQMRLDLQTLFDSFEPLLLDVQKFLAGHNLDFQVKV
ncbi:probable pleckstrin homology domain-containing family A member 8 [Coccomyxa sp. Obi]|nr:probable pleckstrin homology domain-containing family A member 8 [Coccomyxa sp. Obi]